MSSDMSPGCNSWSVYWKWINYQQISKSFYINSKFNVQAFKENVIAEMLSIKLIQSYFIIKYCWCSGAKIEFTTNAPMQSFNFEGIYLS